MHIRHIVLLLALAPFLSLGGGTSNPGSIVPSDVTNIVIAVLSNPVPAAIVVTGHQSNDLSNIQSTTPGNEGINYVGAQGGYKLAEFLEDTSLRGPARDQPIFTYQPAPSVSLAVTWSTGDVYDPETGYHHLVAGSFTLVNNAVNHAYWSTNHATQVQWTTGTRPDAANTIYLATFSVAFGQVIQASFAAPAGDKSILSEAAKAAVFPSYITSGLQVFASSASRTDIHMASGVEFRDMQEQIDHPAINFTDEGFLIFYHHTSGVWTASITNQMPLGVWDDGTNLVAAVSTNWYRGLFVAPLAPHLNYVAPRAAYTSYADVVVGIDPPLPPGFDPYIPPVTSYVSQGSDTTVRTSSGYWLDRRFQISRGSSMASGGSSLVVPNMQQVLESGTGTGGLLPTGMGLPTLPDQAASKAYVDSIANKASSGLVYVDQLTGDDSTAEIETANLPFKTINAAIAAIEADVGYLAGERFLISVNTGNYYESPTLANGISIKGVDCEDVFVYGTFTWPTAFTDSVGSELQLLSVQTTNAPCAVVNAGADEAYVGFRSCAFYAFWDASVATKPVVKVSRGNLESYASTWLENDNYPTNVAGVAGISSIFYGTSDPANPGKYLCNEYSGSHMYRVGSTVDTICINYVDCTNQHSQINVKNAFTEIHMESLGDTTNKVEMIRHHNSPAATFMQGTLCSLDLAPTNHVDVMLAYCAGSPKKVTGSGAHYISSRVRCPNIAQGHSWIGAATTTNDEIECYGSQLAAQTTNYPAKYTADGSAGFVAYAINHLGDLLLSGGIDLNSDDGYGINPSSGHLKFYNQTTAGLETPYVQDSTGLNIRMIRDQTMTGYNAESTMLKVGELVYIASGVSGQSHYIRRASCTNLVTLPAVGRVVNVGGIAPGALGRVFRLGRIESGVDTSMWSPGQMLYAGVVPGTTTNVEPQAPYVSQVVGWCNVSSTNGSITIWPYKPDTLGNQLPSYYASLAGLVFETNRAQVVEAALQAALIYETNRAQVVESGLTNTTAILTLGLAAETNRAQVAEAALTLGLTTETNRAQVAEAALSTRITAETNRAQVAESALTLGLTTETNRAQVAEAALTLGLTTETNRAQVAESGLSTRITTETNRAQVAESTLTTNVGTVAVGLATETNRAQVAESGLSARITSETNRAQVAEAALTLGLTAETNRAQVAEAALSASIVSGTNAIWQTGFVTNLGNATLNSTTLSNTSGSAASSLALLSTIMPPGTSDGLTIYGIKASRVFDGSHNDNYYGLYSDVGSGANDSGTHVGLYSVGGACAGYFKGSCNDGHWLSPGQGYMADVPDVVTVEYNGSSAGRMVDVVSVTATTCPFLVLRQTYSSYTGDVFPILMNVGNQGTFTGNFANWQNASTSRYMVSASGAIAAGYYAFSNLGYSAVSAGSNTIASGAVSYAAGVNVAASNTLSHVWNGDSAVNYGSFGTGTVGFNPVGGAAGFYVGNTALATTMHDTTNAFLSADTSVSNALQTQITALQTPSRFKANGGSTNFTMITGVVPYTNAVLVQGGGIYSNATSQWFPQVSRGILMFHGCFEVTGVAASQTIELVLYKNGGAYAHVLATGNASGAGGGVPSVVGYSWNYVDVVTPALTDYWQVRAVMSTSRVTLNTDTANWWFGTSQ